MEEELKALLDTATPARIIYALMKLCREESGRIRKTDTKAADVYLDIYVKLDQARRAALPLGL